MDWIWFLSRRRSGYLLSQMREEISQRADEAWRGEKTPTIGKLENVPATTASLQRRKVSVTRKGHCFAGHSKGSSCCSSQLWTLRKTSGRKGINCESSIFDCQTKCKDMRENPMWKSNYFNHYANNTSRTNQPCENQLVVHSTQADEQYNNTGLPVSCFDQADDPVKI